jgi:hypothetical protein
VGQHTRPLERRTGERAIDSALLGPSKTLDNALFPYLLARQRFSRVR